MAMRLVMRRFFHSGISRLRAYRASAITWHMASPAFNPAGNTRFLVTDREGDGHNLDEVWHNGPAAIISPKFLYDDVMSIGPCALNQRSWHDDF